MTKIIFIFTFLFCALKVTAQPLIYNDEFIVEISEFEACIKTSCNRANISASVLSGKIGEFQLIGVFKLSGGKGSAGGQSWLSIAKHLWLGTEVTSNFKDKVDAEVMVAGDFSYKWIHLFPYFSLNRDTEKIGGAGVKAYFNKSFSVGVNYLIGDYGNRHSFNLQIGARIHKKGFDKIKQLFDIEK